MNREKFEALIEEAVRDLPPLFQEKLENIAIVVEDYPPKHIAGRAKNSLVLGLYEGVAQPDRSVWSVHLLPDKISIYQKNIEAVCSTEAEIISEVRKTVMHEIGHYFGFDEAELHDMGL
ncbi:metallopeptidase family protein [Candidatus Acetothermia bacterium]|nr:metallopeptidase family protein [Candidatus Acetothermia bacterium]MBI3643442.1 metallopeptidase family protein [Candidatus Acetothermia bacterium]